MQSKNASDGTFCSAGTPVMEGGGQRSCILARGPKRSIGRCHELASHSQIEGQGEAKWPNAHRGASTGSGSPADRHRETCVLSRWAQDWVYGVQGGEGQGLGQLADARRLGRGVFSLLQPSSVGLRPFRGLLAGLPSMGIAPAALGCIVASLATLG